MANLRKWSTTATGNASVAGGANTINFAEGQTPGSVNNSAREMMAQVRGIYTPSDWGWVENSATASVASQTTFKLAGNLTSDWVAPRRWRLKSGSTTRYGTVVSSSFTVETTITVTVDSGSLSASHSLAALSPIDNAGNQLPSFRVASTGDVGIGTISPGATLHLDSPSAVARSIKLSNSNMPTGFSMEVSNGGAGGYLWVRDNSFMSLGTNAAEKARLDSSGNFLITSSGGLGYGTGSGGTVTQITSKATGVTLNKTNGQITMNGAALAASALASFTLTNSTIASSDLIAVMVQGGIASAQSYRVWAAAPSGGSVIITIENRTGGSLSEAVVITFAVIKAVTS